MRRRGLGFVAALRINSTRRTKASRRFCAWVRNRLASIIKTPSWVIRCPARRARRFRISTGSEDPATSNRNCTAVDTLLTFCPPGPEERINSKRILFSSTARSPVIGIMLINYAASANNSSRLIPITFITWIHPILLSGGAVIVERLRKRKGICQRKIPDSKIGQRVWFKREDRV